MTDQRQVGWFDERQLGAPASLIEIDTLVVMTSEIGASTAEVDPVKALHLQSSVRWFALGEFGVMLLSQVWFVTLSWWLVSTRGSGAAIGGVLAVGAIPRAVSMLVGGAVSDRFSPAVVLRATALARLIVLGASFAVASGGSPTWQLYLVSAAFGTIDGFGFPAVTATLPMIASGARLAKMNAFVQLSDQATQIVGPALAAALLAHSGTRSALGVAGCLAVIGLVAFGQLARFVTRSKVAGKGASLVAEIVDGFRYSWRRRDLRAYLLVVGGLGLGTVGPMTLGSAVLARERFGERPRLAGCWEPSALVHSSARSLLEHDCQPWHPNTFWSGCAPLSVPACWA